jgi:hypothetical protein
MQFFFVRGMARVYARQPALVCLLLAASVLAVDYGTGRSIQFPIVYAIPIGLAAWKQMRGMAYGGAVLLPAVRLLFHFPWQEIATIPAGLLNLTITAFSLALYAYLILRTSRQTQALEKQVRNLEGILSICASCKRIRNEDGEYEQMESYISAHSEAMFSHGLCPDCVHKYF